MTAQIKEEELLYHVKLPVLFRFSILENLSQIEARKKFQILVILLTFYIDLKKF